MSGFNRFPAWRTLAIAMGTAAFAAPIPATAQIKVKPLMPAENVPADILVKRIDLNCSVFRSGIRTEKPTEVAAVRAATFAAVDEGHRREVEALTDHVWVVQAWKVAGNLNWVRSARFDEKGTVHLTQLCFRNDGTLARVRQAAADADLDAVSTKQAYFRTDGSLIQASALFERDDPAIPKGAQPPPYSGVLP